MTTRASLTFGDVLKRYRVAAGLTQEELAERAGLSANGISDLERGARMSPRRETIRLLAEALALDEHARQALYAAARPMPTQASPAPALSPAAPARRGAGTGEPPFVGRRAELALIEEHLDGDGATLLMLAGEPGIGKSRLLEEAGSAARARGYTVLAGGCHRRSGQEPYAPILAALERQVGVLTGPARAQALRGAEWLVRLLPELEGEVQPRPLGWRLSPEQERRLSFGAVARFLANVAGPAGTVLLLDDLQWASGDALDLLASLARAEAPAPLRIVGAYRDTETRTGDPLPALLADLARDGLARRAMIEPLGRAEADDLVRRLLADAPGGASGPEAGDAVRSQILQRCGGVPFFLVSCTLGWRGGAQPDVVRARRTPWSVAETIRQRAETLPEPAREALAIAAVAGRATRRRVLLEVARWPEPAMLDALDAACRARLLVEEGDDAYAFAHDLVREVIHDGLSAGRRAVLHRALAEALERSVPTAEPATLAQHYLDAGEDARAIPYLERAGDRARALYAHAEAERHYRALAATLDRLARPLDAAAAREKLADALSTLGRYDEALAALTAAEAVYRGEGRAEEEVRRVCAAAGWLHATLGTPERGLALVDAALDAWPTGSATPGVAALQVARAQLCYVSGRYAEMLAAAEAATRAAEAAGDERALASAEDRRGLALAQLGRIAEGIEVLKTRAIPAAEAQEDLGTMTRALDTLAWAANLHGDFDDMRRTIERALSLMERVGEAGELSFLWFRHAEAAFYAGDWAACEADLARAEELAAGLAGMRYAAFPALGQAILAHARGEPEAADAYLGRALDYADRTNDLLIRRVAQSALAERALLAGDGAAAMASLVPLTADEMQETITLEQLELHAWVRLELGDVERAEELIGHLLARSAEYQLRPARADALRVAALIAMRRGDAARAREALDEAVALCRAMPYQYAEAKANYHYAVLERDQGRPDEARRRAAAARAILDRLGEGLFAGLVARVEASLAGA